MGALLARFRRQPEQRSAVTEQDRAVLDLKVQRDNLKKYQKKIKTQLEKERNVAKDLLREGKKERAKLLLKKKRYLESLLDKADGQMDNLEQMVQNIEFAQIEVQVVEGLKQGNQALEALHKLTSLEDVEQLMADTQDAIEYQRQIDELLAGSLTDEDEDAVLAELDEIIKDQLPEVPTTLPEGESDIIEQLPEIPTGEPRVKEKISRPKEVALA